MLSFDPVAISGHSRKAEHRSCFRKPLAQRFFLPVPTGFHARKPSSRRSRRERQFAARRRALLGPQAKSDVKCDRLAVCDRLDIFELLCERAIYELARDHSSPGMVLLHERSSCTLMTINTQNDLAS
jgi:hypothetical protein